MLSVVEDIPVLSLSGNPFAVAALFELLVGGYLADRAEEVYIQKKETKVLRQTFVKTGKACSFRRFRETDSLRMGLAVIVWWYSRRENGPIRKEKKFR